MPETRTYKKFPNRRLYGPVIVNGKDNFPQSPGYITLADLGQDICNGWVVTIMDHTSKKDITAEVLTQVLLSLAATAFTTEQLHSHIRQAYRHE